ncbi:MAG: FHA domain-containing protein [Planctomycetaceae bacterium]|nr:FHA domain-containing protein [Planctomycetaceae bacterium]
MPSLFVIRGNDQGSRFEFAEGTTSIGRDASNDIQLHDTEVSRRHAQIYGSKDVYTVSDLDSSNGTFVNGRPVEAHRLESGDHLQIGRTLMLFTQPPGAPEVDLSDKVAISSDKAFGDQSHIVHSVSHEESSHFFELSPQVEQSAWLARARGNLQAMYRAALAVSQTLDIDKLLHRIMELIFESVEADRGCVMLTDADTGRLQPKVQRTRRNSKDGDRITISETILDYVMENGEGVLTSDAQQDDRWNPAASIVRMGIREAICVPMRGRYDIVGVIYIDTSTSPQELMLKGVANRFSEDHLKLMVAIAHQAALAVEDTRYYSAMVQAERLAAVGQTIATLSHHIKNILQGIRGGSYLIEMGLSEHDETVVRKGWKIVEKNQNKISALVLDMLTFSKEREPDLQPADINRVVCDVVELMQAHAADLDVAVHCRLADDIPTLVFDPEGMHRAILNVITNAIDAAADSERSGNVEVATAYLPEDGKIQVSIRDDGPGIPADEMEALFRPFVSSKKSRGTGLGLPVSQKILSEHGGRIAVESYPGKGSCFSLELPAVAPGTGREATSQTTIEEP